MTPRRETVRDSAQRKSKRLDGDLSNHKMVIFDQSPSLFATVAPKPLRLVA